MSQIQNLGPNNGGGGGGTLSTLTGNSGGAVGPTGGNINVVGTGNVNVVGNPGTSTLTISVTGTMIPWTVVTSASQTIAVNNGYIANNAGTINFSLPGTSAVGDIFEITSINNATGWTITQAAGQQIRFGDKTTTAGVGGALSATANGDSVRCVCVVADTNWNVLSSQGNIDYV